MKITFLPGKPNISVPNVFLYMISHVKNITLFFVWANLEDKVKDNVEFLLDIITNSNYIKVIATQENRCCLKCFGWYFFLECILPWKNVSGS